VFLVIYDLFLKRETFFQWNRLYLIATYSLSLIIPWIKIEAMKTTVPESFQAYPEFLWNLDNTSIVVTESTEPSFNIAWEYMLLFGGMFLATLFFIYKLNQIKKLKKQGKKQTFQEFTQYIINNSNAAFSFFKSIFLGDKVLEKEHERIVQHELVHIRQRHSYDLLFFEMMRIVGWFNPLVYVYQSRVSELHEYIADAQVAKTHKKEQYQLLLSEVFQTQNISFINQFFKKSLIKKRIVMLTKEKSKKVWQLKYLLLLPLVLSMLAYTSAEFQESQSIDQNQTTDDAKLIAEINKWIDEAEDLQIVLTRKKLQRLDQDKNYVLTKRQYFKKQILTKRALQITFTESAAFRREKEQSWGQIPLPSTLRYQSYINRKKAFQILDKNLMISINQKELAIRKITKEDKNLGPGEFIVVEDVSDLTGDEIRNINQKIAHIDFGKRFLFISDNEDAFLITKAGAKSDKNNGKMASMAPFDTSIEDLSKTILVNDIENLTVLEEYEIIKAIKNISKKSDNWALYVKDDKSSLKFMKSDNGSYLTGPNGERIDAKMVYDSSLSEKGKLSITEFLSNNGTTNFTADKVGKPNNESFKQLKPSDPIPFATVDEVPIFPGCEDADDRRQCFQEKIQRHIAKHFSYPKEAQEKGIQGRVSTIFEISKKGSIQNIRMRGPDSLLEKEVERIIKRLPKMIPGKHKGKKVVVPFSIPISFKLNNENAFETLRGTKQMISQYNRLLAERNRLLKSASENNPVIINLDSQIAALKKAIDVEQDGETVPFANVEEVPIFPGCEDAVDKRKCFNEKIQRHISKNFNYPKEAQEKGIQGRVAVMFTIATDGSIQKIRKRGRNALLENEAERIIKRLPTMKPGKHKGRLVNVPFSIPVTFKLRVNKKEELRLSEVAGKEPLLILDGKVYYGELNAIDPNTIESMFVLKGEKAKEKYGEKAKNGVVEIITKKKD
jgi:TonB family protein